MYSKDFVTNVEMPTEDDYINIYVQYILEYIVTEIVMSSLSFF